MIDLTEMQAAALSAACERSDGAIVLPASWRGAAVRAFNARLLVKGWAQEVVVDGASVRPWRKGADGTCYGLVLTPAGRNVVAIEREADRTAAEPAAQAARPATKLALLLEQMSCMQGATLATLTAATGWQPHTVRAAVVRLRQKGHAIERDRGADGVSRYRLNSSGAAETTTTAPAA
ncbi:hypothetical protein BTHI11S_05858 [Bosea thiooxidans]|uniref:DUF3489 domain-containing protein n=1 Tax=Bosea thiooxidans TaxID=53254 RepID=A0A1T5FNC7_9HYPH|nr:DUF3489 domain-containing protein [Bosea thiooxidans]SKB97618.1 Protein of unknown function [Bosea thiooxidans]